MVTYATSSTFGVIARDLDVPIVLVALAAAEGDGLRAGLDLHAALQRRLLLGAGVHRRGHPHGRKAAAGDSGHAARRSGGRRRNSREWCEHRQGAARPAPGADRPLRPRARADARHADRPDGPHRRLRLPRRADRGRRSAAARADRHRGRDRRPRRRQILDLFDTPDPESDPITTQADRRATCTWPPRVAVALDKFVDEKQLDGLAYYYEARRAARCGSW